MKPHWLVPSKTGRRCEVALGMTSIVARRELPNQNAIGQTIGHGKAMVGFLLAFGLSLVLSSCGILDTRTPQPPAQTSSTFTPPTSPSMVIDNLINAIGERNTDNYIRCLADSNFSDRKFQFVPTQEALSKYALQFSTWSVSSEREYFENLKSQMPTTPPSSQVHTISRSNTTRAECRRKQRERFSSTWLRIGTNSG
jgi:hypothetical protein